MRIWIGSRARRLAGGLGCLLAGLLIGGIGVAGAATGGSFVLGKVNQATSTSTLRSTQGTPLALRAGDGAPPLRVDSSAEVKRLNAAEVGGVSLGGLQQAIGGTCGDGIAAVTSAGDVTCVAAQTVLTKSASWVVPAGVHAVRVTAVGGGGGGAVAGKDQQASGGGSGATVDVALSVSPGEKFDIIVGAGGRAGSGGTAGAGQASLVYRQSESGALLVRAAGGRAGAASKASGSCRGGGGGVPGRPSTNGAATALTATAGEPGSCPAGGGAAGYPGSGGTAGRSGSAGESGTAGVVVITLAS